MFFQLPFKVFSMFANAWNKAREAAASVKEGVADAATKAKEAALGPQREIATPTTIVCDESLPDNEIRVNLQKKLEELGERQRPSIQLIVVSSAAAFFLMLAPILAGEFPITDAELEAAVENMRC